MSLPGIDALKAALRDYVINGVPVTGFNDPVKLEMRNGFSQLGNDIMSRVAGWTNYELKSQLPAVTSADNGIQARVYDDPTPEFNTIYTVIDGVWVVDTDYINTASLVVQPLVDDAAGSAAQAEASATDAATAVTKYVPSISSSATALGNGQAIPYSFTDATSYFDAALGLADWAGTIKEGADIDAGAPIETGGAVIGVASGTTTVRIKLWSRATSDTNMNGNYGPGQLIDALLDTVELTPTEMGLTIGAAPIWVDWTWNTPQIAQSGKTYFIEIDALDADGDRMAMPMGFFTDSASPDQRERGYYKADVSTSTWSGVSGSSRLAVRLGKRSYISVKSHADALESRSAILGQQQSAGTFSGDTSGNFYGWSRMIQPGLPGEPSVGDVANAITVPNVIVHASATKVRLTLRQRPITASQSTAPSSSDQLVFTQSYPVADIGLVPGVDAFVDGSSITLPFPDYTFDEAYWLIWEVDAINASGTRVFISPGFKTITSGSLPDGQCAFYRTTTGGGLDGFSATLSLAYYARGAAVDVGAAKLIDYVTADQIQACDLSSVNLTVSVSVTLNRQGVPTTINRSVTHAAPTSGHVTSEAVSLAYVDGSTNMTSMTFLAHANVTGVVVTRVSDSAVLVEGTDYVLNKEHGGIAKKASGSADPVTVAYYWSARRYDVIYLDPEAMTLGIVQGAEGVRDAAERVPGLGGSKRIALCTVRVVAQGFDIPSQAIPTPVWQIENGFVHRKVRAQYQIDRRRNRKALRATFTALRKAQAVDVYIYSDSIMSLEQGGSPSATTPNGTHRDRAADGYLNNGVIGSDLRGGIALYDFGDGAGQVHTKWGMARDLTNALAANYASTIDVYNFGFGGSTTGSGTNNGSNATRMGALTTAIAASVTAGRQPLVILEFGMNELGDGNTESQLATIRAAAMAAGADVIIVGTPRPNFASTSFFRKKWQFTNRINRRVAEYIDPATGKTAAFIDFLAIADDDTFVLGIDKRDLCLTNLYNHPGMREHGIYGLPLVDLFAD